MTERVGITTTRLSSQKRNENPKKTSEILPPKMKITVEKGGRTSRTDIPFFKPSPIALWRVLYKAD